MWIEATFQRNLGLLSVFTACETHLRSWRALRQHLATGVVLWGYLFGLEENADDGIVHSYVVDGVAELITKLGIVTAAVEEE